MFSMEDGALDIINQSLNEYEKKFDAEFPLYEYIDITKGNGFDFSVEGSERLKEFISERIEKNKPVDVPEGYFDRLY